MEIEIEQSIKNKEEHLSRLEVNCEEIQEIITAVPSWIVRRGIALIFILLLAIVGISALIQYPDVVKTSLKVNSMNAPKAVLVKQTGKIVALLVKEGSSVKQGQTLAFMESTAIHNDVLKLQLELAELSRSLIRKGMTTGLTLNNLNLGELQAAYQSFYQQYLQYVSAQSGGYYLNRKQFLLKDLKEIDKLKEQIIKQQKVQEQEYINVQHEYDTYKKLYEKGVVSTIDYKQHESKYLSGKYPLQQSVTALLNNSSSYAAKQKEILDLEHTIQEERSKFVQSLSNMQTQTESWINQYILKAPVAGKVNYAGIVQENQTVNGGQELFMINPANTDFFGEVQIPQYNMGKVRIGQRTLIKMRSFPFEQYGLIRGRLDYISDVAIRDSVFIAKVGFERYENKDPEHKIVLKNGMQADVEIITEDSSLLQRFMRNITKILNSN